MEKINLWFCHLFFVLFCVLGLFFGGEVRGGLPDESGNRCCGCSAQISFTESIHPSQVAVLVASLAVQEITLLSPPPLPPPWGSPQIRPGCEQGWRDWSPCSRLDHSAVIYAPETPEDQVAKARLAFPFLLPSLSPRTFLRTPSCQEHRIYVTVSASWKLKLRQVLFSILP